MTSGIRKGSLVDKMLDKGFDGSMIHAFMISRFLVPILPSDFDYESYLERYEDAMIELDYTRNV